MFCFISDPEISLALNSYLKKEKMSQLDLAVEKLYDAVRIRTDIEYEEKRMIPGTLKGFPDSKDLEKLSEGEFAEIFTKVYRLPENSDPCFWAGVWIDATQKGVDDGNVPFEMGSLCACRCSVHLQGTRDC